MHGGAVSFLEISRLVLGKFYSAVPLHLCLTGEPLRVTYDAHILFASVAFTEVFHPLSHVTQAGSAEAVPPAGVLYRYAVIQSDLQ